ncbi:TetR/AcrR family transcriptional regulator [Methylobacterium sp. WL64]|uniref:TetR/AcrR family transcriptional regulator n=1 Tax=Methylobacterium sp. WL64 TaxID=2603894 RepID=UPI0011CA97A9|nr:TetR/AcrR family transcriptional regulator [Methylobacterium sp. WL64]TXN00164.1 TetR/AcrR family transcriptional regulator [Methylobacterium sp. WL64]
MPVKTYHHGDLRTALLDAGLEMLSLGDVENISLREIARRVGVSAPAVYHHFPDKASLLAALARVGLKRLEDAAAAASHTAGGGQQGFFATGCAYVEFAVANPALFRLVMTLDPSLSQQSKGLADLMVNAARFAPEGADVQTYSLQCWSLVHGLAMLFLDGQVPFDRNLVASVVSVQTFLGVRETVPPT